MALDRRGNIALVEAPALHGPERGLFLPGGGIEAGENHQACILRECLEETGRQATVVKFLRSGDEYLFSPQWREYVHVTGHCYLVTLGEKVCEPVEKDHVFMWMPAENCRVTMFLRYQAWAVEAGLEEREIRQ